MMPSFTILLLVAIGSVYVELERTELLGDKLKAYTVAVDESEDSKRPTNSSDDKVRSFDLTSDIAQETDQVENMTSRSFSSVIDDSTVKAASAKAGSLQKIRELLHFGKHARRETNAAGSSRKLLRRRRTAEAEDPTNTIESFKSYQNVRNKLPAPLRMKTRKTDKADEKLLSGYASSSGDTSSLLADYKSEMSAEREQLKTEAAGSGGKEVIDNYKALRKCKPWNYVQLRGRYKAFFENPSSSLKEYKQLKYDEVSSLDRFLGGTSSEDDEFIVEETLRIVRAKETDSESWNDVTGDATDDVLATTEDNDDVRGNDEIYEDPVYVTSARVTSPDGNTKDSNHLLRFAILFAIIMQIIIAVVILEPHRSKLVEWCNRTKRTEFAGSAETDPLHGKGNLLTSRPVGDIRVSTERRPDHVTDALP